VKPTHPQATFTFKRAQEMLGLSRTVVAGLIGAGFVTPQHGPRNEHRFTFQDLALLRTAYALQQAKIAPRKIVGALAKLRATLPEELPLTGLRITAVGADVAVRDRDGPRSVATGQLLMDFEVTPSAGSVAFISSDAEAQESPEHWFRLGEQAEGADKVGAEAAYRRAIELSPRFVHAYLNLGALLCEASRCDEASSLYEAAYERGADDPLLRFNHAIALEDQGAHAAALKSYERAIELDATLADAHYNAGRLLEARGDSQGALRHFNAYRRLQRNENA
jgi:tetratricopeptide (TPR) repeat protein